MKVGCLGCGAWGFTLANMLARHGHQVMIWARSESVIQNLKESGEHPKFPGFKKEDSLIPTSSFEEVIDHADILLESVTTSGIRGVFTKLKKLYPDFNKPIVFTSKGIEKTSGLLIDELVLEVMGVEIKDKLGCIAGPCIAKEVMEKLPASAVCSAHSKPLIETIQQLFTNPYFRVYPNTDFPGVEFGGAMKNPIAIACGISDGLGFGTNTKAAIMTRGLHEIRKLSKVKKAKPETLNGLAGLGDLCTTCLSKHSRNYRFGFLLAEGLSAKQAKDKIGMVIEGASTCISVIELGAKFDIETPITKAVYSIIYDNVKPLDAVKALLSREIKHEHL